MKRRIMKIKKGICYVIIPGQRDDQGIIPSVVREGIAGHFPLMKKDGVTPCHWGYTEDAARSVCGWMNELIGLTQDEIDRMVGMSLGRVAA